MFKKIIYKNMTILWNFTFFYHRLEIDQVNK